jgi:hypothetical protein
MATTGCRGGGGEQVETLVERCAGLDVHKDSVTACVRVLTAMVGARPRLAGSPRPPPGWCCWPSGWPASGVTRVGMEATGQYWKPCVRHEAPCVRAEVKGLRLRPVAAGR